VGNQVATKLTKGRTKGKYGPLNFGKWAALINAHWGVWDVIVDPYAKSKRGAGVSTTRRDVESAVRHAESFAAIKDIVTG
ncbi:hypothetical protein BWD08_11160, partial [Neisseria animaloris]